MLIFSPGHLFVTFELTVSTYRSPSWERDSLSSGLKTFRLLWNSKAHCYVHNRPYWIVSGASWIQSATSYPVYLRYILPCAPSAILQLVSSIRFFLSKFGMLPSYILRVFHMDQLKKNVVPARAEPPLVTIRWIMNRVIIFITIT